MLASGDGKRDPRVGDETGKDLLMMVWARLAPTVRISRCSWGHRRYPLRRMENSKRSTVSYREKARRSSRGGGGGNHLRETRNEG